jgi:protein-disulfide isomerase
MGGVLLLCALAACQSREDELAEIRQVQEKVLERLTQLEEGQQRLLAERASKLPERPSEDFDRIYTIPIGDSPVRGNSEASVTIVEFADFQCRFCAESASVLKAILEKHGDDVRLVYKHFPLSFHEQARAAARAALAAQEQRRFWEMHDLLFENFESLSAENSSRLASEAGLDVELFRNSYESNRETQTRRINADYALGLRLDVRGTPTLFVNGRKVRHRTLQGISARINEELGRASPS